MIFSTSKKASPKGNAKSGSHLVFIQPEVISPEKEGRRLAATVGRAIKSIFAETTERTKKASAGR
jgi:hypothetical protein